MAEFGEIVKPILVIMVVLVLAFVAFPMIKEGANKLLGFDLFPKKTSEKVELPTVLSDKVQELLSSKLAFAQSSAEYTIKPKEEILVGFDTVWDDNQRVGTCPTFSNDKIPKPKACNGKACLCKFKHTFFSTFAESNVISCATFDGNVVFLGEPKSIDTNNYNEGIPKSAPGLLTNQDYEYLVLYGKCGDALPYSKLYVDVAKTAKVNYVYVALYRSTSETDRKNAQGCPPGIACD